MHWTNPSRLFVILFALITLPVSAQAQSLPAVTGVAYDGQDITWDSVEGATGYNIHLNFDYLDTVGNTNSYTPATEGKYYVVAYNDAGQYSPLQVITSDVVPTSNSVEVGTESGQGESEGENGGGGVSAVQLGLVIGTTYDGTALNWDALPGATGYNIHRGFDYVTTIINATTYVPVVPGRYYVIGFDDAGNYSPLEIIVGADSTATPIVNVSFEQSTEEETTTGLAAVSNAVYDGESITWDALAGATGYNVHYFFQGTTGWTYLTTVGDVTSYVPAMAGSYLIVGYDDAGNFGPFQVVEGDQVVSTNSVRIIALGTATEPNPEPVEQKSLAAVTGVAYDGQVITWDAVEGATGYNIHIDDFAYLTTVGNVTTFTPSVSAKYYVVAFDDEGNYSPIQIIESDIVPTSNSVVVN